LFCLGGILLGAVSAFSSSISLIATVKAAVIMISVLLIVDYIQRRLKRKTNIQRK
jgi:hypothetical protein